MEIDRRREVLGVSEAARFALDAHDLNDRTRRWSTNLRFSWLQTAGTGLFLVYNDTEGFNGLGPLNRAFILKYSRQVDLLR